MLQAAVETAKLGVVAAQSLQDSVEREMRRLSKRSRRGSVRNRRRSITALRPGGLTGSGDTPRARVQGPPEDDVAAEDDIRTVMYVIQPCGCGCGCVAVAVAVAVWLWLCGCVAVWLCVSLFFTGDKIRSVQI